MRVVLGSLAAVTVLTGGAAAATVPGTGRAEVLRGTQRADLILARGGRDVVEALGGDDRIAVQYDGARDVVRCGRGRDIVTADRIDRVAADCEVVSRMISRDSYADPAGIHETQVEPHVLAVGSTLVATFQSGRRFDGGASDIGFSTSRDGGRTWRDGHLPAVTVNSRPAGTPAFASDPVVAYDPVRRVWLISTLAVSETRTELYMSRSADGLRWGRPVVAARFEGSGLAYDKNWAACDDRPESPYLGRCYLVYTDHVGGNRPKLAVQASDDGGLTWSEAVIAVRAPEAVGVIPVVRPDGSLVMTYLGRDRIESVRSTDGGRSFEQPVTVSPFSFRTIRGMRSFPLPTADVDALGRVYVAWQDCRFRAGCSANDVVLSTSDDGTAWSEPARVTRDGGTDFIPAIAVDRGTGKLAVAYHRCTGSPCRIDVLLTTSASGVRWSAPQLLNAQPMRPAWIPRTRSGRMLADYIGLQFVGRRAVTVYALASEPRGGKLRQAITASRG
jgi:hypothetical protein